MEADRKLSGGHTCMHTFLHAQLHSYTPIQSSMRLKGKCCSNWEMYNLFVRQYPVATHCHIYYHLHPFHLCKFKDLVAKQHHAYILLMQAHCLIPYVNAQCICITCFNFEHDCGEHEQLNPKPMHMDSNFRVGLTLRPQSRFIISTHH